LAVLCALPFAPVSDVTAARANGAFTAGGRSAGDRLFPQLGNTGYDARHYDLVLSYVPGGHLLSGTSAMTAQATENLRELSLDFQGFSISALTVNGVAAAFQRLDTKLVITPAAPLLSGTTFTVAVTYSGQPPVVTDPDGSTEGWLRTYDGAFVVGEPMGAQGFFPCNNHPIDKATFDETVTVPLGLSVIGNGELVSHTDGVGMTAWHWRESNPMATYLATMTLGAFRVVNSVTARGLPRTDAIDVAYPSGPAAGGARSSLDIDATLGRQADMIAFFETLYGTYPFMSAGGIVAVAPDVGYALETQTKPNYPLPPSAVTVAHETSHQWFGDSVSLTQFQDMWLNEGFATISQWLYDERRNNGPTAASIFANDAARAGSDAFWQTPPAAPPTAADIFATPVYQRGGDTLEGLREIVGDAAFATIMTAWATDHRHGWGTTPQFVALALDRSALNTAGRAQLAEFFRQWLFGKGKPTIGPADVRAAAGGGVPTVVAAKSSTRSAPLPATGPPFALEWGVGLLALAVAARRGAFPWGARRGL
jgi:aminopeptidase N